MLPNANVLNFTVNLYPLIDRGHGCLGTTAGWQLARGPMGHLI